MGVVYALEREGQIIAVGPTSLALADAIRPLAFPCRVDPSFWMQRALLAEDLLSPGTLLVNGVRWRARAAPAPG